MKQKWMAILLAFMLMILMTACGAEQETTTTGMVVSVNGTKISLMEMDTSTMGGAGFAGGEMPERPEGMEGMEGFPGFGDFDFEDFSGTMPEGGDYPQWGNGELPDDFTIPEGGSMPSFGGSMPDFGSGRPNFGGNGSGFGNMDTDAETKEFDIGKAHISVQIDGGKASGSLDDIKAGTFVTLTMNGKGEVTNVLVSSMSGFGGGRIPMT